MWQRFTERARRIVFFAQEEAGRLGENYVSTEHLLLGLAREHDTVAARILETLGVSLERIRTEIERQVSHGEGRSDGDMQLTPRAKRVIDYAYDEARHLGNNYIGTEHLLLGLIREENGLAGRVLVRLGVDLERAREEVKKLLDELSSPDPEEPKTSTSPAPAGSNWTRFSERARRVVFFAQEEAGRLGGNSVSTEHILLGIVRGKDDSINVACRILERLDVSLERIQSEVESQVGRGEAAIGQDMQLTPSGKRVIDLAYEEARALGNNYIGSEHLLLGLIREGEGLAGQVLASLGVKLERARAELQKLQDKSDSKLKSAPERKSSWQSTLGDLGILKPGGDSSVAMAVKIAPEQEMNLITTWNSRDPYGWRELIESGAVISLPAGTAVKFLQLVSGNLALVRVFEGEREGEALYIPWASFEFTGEDTAPWPPG